MRFISNTLENIKIKQIISNAIENNIKLHKFSNTLENIDLKNYIVKNDLKFPFSKFYNLS